MSILASSSLENKQPLASVASLRIDVKKSRTVSPFSASTISAKPLAASFPKVKGMKVEPAASKEFFIAFQQKKTVIEELASNLKGNIDSLHQIALLVKKEADDLTKASTLYTKITSALATLKTLIGDANAYLDNYSKANTLAVHFIKWSQKTKKSLTKIRENLKTEYAKVHELFGKAKEYTNPDPITVDGVTPIPASFQEMANRFFMKKAEVIDRGLTQENDKVLRQILQDFRDSLAQVKERQLSLILNALFKQMSQGYEAIPKEIEKSKITKEFCKFCTSLTQELTIMAERAEARLKKRDLKVLTMPRVISDKLSSIDDQVQSALKKFPFLEKKTVDEQLQALKKAQAHLATYLEKIQAAAPDLKKPATKRKDSPSECTEKSAKKIKAVMSQSDKALRLQKQMQRTLIMQSYLPNHQAALSEFEQIKQKLAEIYKDSETPVTLFTLFQMTAKEDLARVKKIQVQDFSPSEIEGTFAAFCAKQVEKELTKTVANFHTFILPLLDEAQKEGAQKWLEEFCSKAKTT